MDGLNKGIVYALSRDGRMPFLEIAKELGVSEGTIRNRVAKLVRHGVIRRFTIELGDAGVISGVVCVRTDPHRGTSQIGAALRALSPQVRWVFEVSGEYDLFCNVESPTVSEMNALVERIRLTRGVMQTQTFMVLNKL